MYPSTARLGFWSAFCASIAWLIFTVCFIAIAVINRPLFLWTNLPDFIAYTRTHDQTLAYVAQACMVLVGPLYVMMVSSLHGYTPPERKGVVQAALVLGTDFAILTGINYFSHITAIRFNLARGTTAQLEQFLQHKPDSVMAAINMLGWTVYFGLSTLLASSAFAQMHGRLERAIRIALTINGICCLLAGVGFVIDNIVLIFLTINLGMGGAITTATILLCIFFRRQGRISPIMAV